MNAVIEILSHTVVATLISFVIIGLGLSVIELKNRPKTARRLLRRFVRLFVEFDDRSTT